MRILLLTHRSAGVVARLWVWGYDGHLLQSAAAAALPADQETQQLYLPAPPAAAPPVTISSLVTTCLLIAYLFFTLSSHHLPIYFMFVYIILARLITITTAVYDDPTSHHQAQSKSPPIPIYLMFVYIILARVTITTAVYIRRSYCSHHIKLSHHLSIYFMFVYIILARPLLSTIKLSVLWISPLNNSRVGNLLLPHACIISLMLKVCNMEVWTGVRSDCHSIFCITHNLIFSFAVITAFTMLLSGISCILGIPVNIASHLSYYVSLILGFNYVCLLSYWYPSIQYLDQG